MIPVVTPREAAQLDKYMIEERAIPGILLMEQAADEVARQAMRLADGGRILVVCGKGNNGGDGLAAARILLSQGCDVRVGVTSEEYSGDAGANFEFFKKNGDYALITHENLGDFFSQDAAVIVDALFGTGLSRAPMGLYDELICEINAHSASVVSVDIPSGVFGETGYCKNAVFADVTVTFQHPKTGHFIYPGAEHTGKLIIKKIGVESGRKYDKFLVDDIKLPQRRRNTNKGSYGRLAILAGSRELSGAAILCARAALRTGAGLVSCMSDEMTCAAMKAALPEAMAAPCGEYSVSDIDKAIGMIGASPFVMGPGLGTGDEVTELICSAAELENKKVIDADAINVLARFPELIVGSKCVITPHPKEFSRLTKMSMGDILSDPLGCAKRYAREAGVVVLLKGASTVITDGSLSYIVAAGAPSMAKGGSGDVLSGVTGALIAQGYGLLQAAYTAAYLCGKAGEAAYERLGGYAPLASDTIENLFRVEM